MRGIAIFNKSNTRITDSRKRITERGIIRLLAQMIFKKVSQKDTQ